jgi:ribosomal protein S18 acetylase RimI-like enzyme
MRNLVWSKFKVLVFILKKAWEEIVNLRGNSAKNTTIFCLIPLMKIRPLVPEDIERMKTINPEGWPDITRFFQFYFSNPFCFPYVAEENGKLIGSGNYIRLGSSAWLGHIIVIPEYRNHGLGKSITELLVTELQKAGCPSIYLIATEMGEAVYKKVGFQAISKYLFLKGELKEIPSVKGLRPFVVQDLEAILKMDKKVSGEDRTALLSSASEGWVIESGSGLRGFYLKVWDGPVLAENRETGLALLGLRMKDKPYIVLPEENVEAIQFLYQHNFSECHPPGIRMVLGKQLLWDPTMIYGRIAGSFG